MAYVTPFAHGRGALNFKHLLNCTLVEVRVCTEVVFKSIYLYFAFYLKYLLWN